MSNPNILPSDRVTLAGVIDPDAYTAAAYSTSWAPMSTFESVMATVLAGTLGASATVNAKLEQAQDGSGTGVKDITGKAITPLTQAGSDSDKQAIINCRSEELDVNNDFTHVRLTVTVGVATSDMGATLHGLDARYQPAADLASVDEVIA